MHGSDVCVHGRSIELQQLQPSPPLLLHYQDVSSVLYILSGAPRREDGEQTPVTGRYPALQSHITIHDRHLCTYLLLTTHGSTAFPGRRKPKQKLRHGSRNDAVCPNDQLCGWHLVSCSLDRRCSLCLSCWPRHGEHIHTHTLSLCHMWISPPFCLPNNALRGRGRAVPASSFDFSNSPSLPDGQTPLALHSATLPGVRCVRHSRSNGQCVRNLNLSISAPAST